MNLVKTQIRRTKMYPEYFRWRRQPSEQASPDDIMLIYARHKTYDLPTVSQSLALLRLEKNAILSNITH